MFQQEPRISLREPSPPIIAAGAKFDALIIQCFMKRSRLRASSRPDPPVVCASSSSRKSYRVPSTDYCNDKSWNDVRATVQFLERGAAGETPWRKVGKQFSRGDRQTRIRLGYRLARAGNQGHRQKGSDRNLLRCFQVILAFRDPASPDQVSFLRFPYEQVGPSTEAIDDPPPDTIIASSTERSQIPRLVNIGIKCWRLAGRYRFGVMLEHNWSQFPIRFLHFFSSLDTRPSGTAGCTAVSLINLERLSTGWMPIKSLIVQLPITEYLRLKQSLGIVPLGRRETLAIIFAPSGAADKRKPGLRVIACLDKRTLWLSLHRSVYENPFVVALVGLVISFAPPAFGSTERHGESRNCSPGSRVWLRTMTRHSIAGCSYRAGFYAEDAIFNTPEGTFQESAGIEELYAPIFGRCIPRTLLP